MADNPTLKDSLVAASSSADYQRKMAKAMRVRSERHDQVVVDLKAQHQNQVIQMNEDAQRAAEEQTRRFQAELQRQNEAATDRLEDAVENMRRAKDEEMAQVLKELRYELEENHNSRLSAVMSQHQEAFQGLQDQHKAELRERMSHMAMQKDELSQAEKSEALKTARAEWTTEASSMVELAEARLSHEHAKEIDSIRGECERAIQDLTTKYALERQQLGGDMLDDREATRAITAKAEQEKAAKAAEALNKKLADEHENAVSELRCRFEQDLMETVAKAQGEQEAALRQQASKFSEQVSSLEKSLSTVKADYEEAARQHNAANARVLIALENERDELALRLRSQRDDKGNFSTGRTVATAISVALIAVLATYAMFMVVQYREWLFFAYALDKRFT